ncbi:MAG: NmrA family NAD(P)-binding protein [Oculatellaceae cyanobacterium Prado106]|jgi:uncharacterized protein YbjT (DUF2867 family)|nr:NmrA family NAD(P)-binding protein [Oculatellaceae cyanobacterium Prado106]
MILVTGATGRVGRVLVEGLLQTGNPVSILVRHPQKAESLKALGAVVWQVDWHQLESVETALRQGRDLCVDDRPYRLCSIPANTLNQAEQEIQLFQAAERAGVERLVKLSTIKANLASPCLFFRQHAIAEHYLSQQATIPFTVLQSNSFMQNFLWFADEIRTHGTLSLPLGNAKTAPVDIRDLVRVAAVVLTEKNLGGTTYPGIYNITGREALSMQDIVDRISKRMEKRITYIAISAIEFQQMLLDAGMPEWKAEAIAQSWQVASSGEPTVTDTVQSLTGKQPTTFTEWLQSHLATFSPIRS